MIKGFKEGFDIEYEGEPYRQDYAQNIPFRSVGSSEELWEKLMKEVRLKRYARPFAKHPLYKNFTQISHRIGAKGWREDKTDISPEL